MDRVMSVEEKIKRAEEIHARRHEFDNKNTTTLYLHGKEKKDIKLFKKMILQIVVCLLIYLIFYTVQNNNYIFSEDFINKAKGILSYDTNFGELYNYVNNSITKLFDNNENKNDNNNTEEVNDNHDNTEKTEKDEDSNIEQNIGGGNENTKQEESNELSEEQNSNEIVNTSSISDEEQEILQIKNTTTFIKPVQGQISSRYGIRNPTTSTVPKNHTGTDIAATLGTKIVASTDGEVILASSQGDYGNHLKIKIGNVTTVYAHCNKLYVKEGEKVLQGQEIAEVGSTGNSTGPHLHFEIRFNDKIIDPEKILEL